jgi:hypothetical protein
LQSPKDCSNNTEEDCNRHCNDSRPVHKSWRLLTLWPLPHRSDRSRIFSLLPQQVKAVAPVGKSFIQIPDSFWKQHISRRVVITVIWLERNKQARVKRFWPHILL